MDEDSTPDKAEGVSPESPLDALARAAESVDSPAAAQEAAAAAAEGAPGVSAGDASVHKADKGSCFRPLALLVSMHNMFLVAH